MHLLNVLGEDGHALGVQRAQVAIFEQPDEVGLGSLLQRQHGGGLEAQVVLEVLGDFAHEPLERELADQQVGRLLVAADLTKSDCARAVTVRFLDAACQWRVLASGLGGQLFTGRLASPRLSRCLLGSRHCLDDDDVFAFAWEH